MTYNHFVRIGSLVSASRFGLQRATKVGSPARQKATPLPSCFAAVAATMLLAAACTGGAPAPTPTTAPAPAAQPTAAAKPTTPAAASPAAAPVASPAAPQPSVAASPAAAKPAASAFAVSGPPITVRLAYNTSNIQHLPTQIARDLNLFQKYGLDVQFAEMESGVDMSKVLLSNQLDVINTTVTEVADARAAGEDERLIATNYDVPTDGLFVRPDIASGQDLKGKKVAISRFGSQSELTMRLLVRKQGLDETKDVTIVQVGGESTRVKAVLAGTVDATPAESSNRRALERQGLKMLDSLADPNGPGGATHGLVTTGTVLKNNREGMRRVIMAMSEAQWIIKNRPDQANPSVAKMINSTDPQEIADVQQAQGLLERLPPVSDVTKVAYTLKLIEQTDPNGAKQNPSEIIDNSLVEELDRAGFFAQLGR